MIDYIIDIGDEVICDLCNSDYTESEQEGGLLVGSWAVCPECVTSAMKADATAVPIKDESFRDFVIRHRTHSTCGVMSW